MSWPCFMVEKGRPVTELVIGHGVHPNLHRTVLDTLEVEFGEVDLEAYDWPEACPECGATLAYDREVDGSWRTKVGTHMYVRVDNAAEAKHAWGHGPGAMFDADWLGDAYRGPDGLRLSVVLPPVRDGALDVWHIDGPSSDGGRWTRTGTPPNVTVSPSILTNAYHGFLQNGVLSDSLPDRPLP